MIVSVSRRTDIPAFYPNWFMERIKAGFCTVFNPFNKNQVSYVSLKPEDVDVIVFWTKNAKPLLPYLKDLDAKGYKYYFQYTLNGYPSIIEKSVPKVQNSIHTFKRLTDMIGAEKVIWRYDPILLSNITDYEFHKQNFRMICNELKGSTKRVVISVVDDYRKAASNFKQLKQQGVDVYKVNDAKEIASLITFISDLAKENGMEIYSCAEKFDLRLYGVLPGKCIDEVYIRDVFGINISNKKDTAQREECGCIQSKDIGVYDTCFHGCTYCYAGTLAGAQKNIKEHYSDSSSLIGRHEVDISCLKSKVRKSDEESEQLKFL